VCTNTCTSYTNQTRLTHSATCGTRTQDQAHAPAMTRHDARHGQHVITNTLQTRRAHTHDQIMTWFIPTDLKGCLLSGSEISSSSLKTLVMVNCNMFWGLTISAPNLVLLRCVKPIGQASSFKNLDSLVSGTIILDDYFLVLILKTSARANSMKPLIMMMIMIMMMTVMLT
jgi:hypothetical protein